MKQGKVFVKEIPMDILLLLNHARLHNDIMVISTEWSTYEDCRVTAIDDETVEFTAIYPLKGGEYDFAFQYSSIRTVENITNNEQMWFQQTNKGEQQ
jgi:hypothetical protein